MLGKEKEEISTSGWLMMTCSSLTIFLPWRITWLLWC